MPLGEVHKADGLFEVAPTTRLVPLETELVPALELPVRIGEERADVHPKAAPPGAVEPAFEGARKVHHGGDPGEQELRVGHLHRRPSPRLVEGEGAGPLVEPGVVHLGHPVVLAHPLAGRFGVRVGVEVDEAGHDEAPRAVDDAVRGARVAPADVDDAVAGEGDVPTPKVAVAAAVPGRDPGGVSNHGGRIVHARVLRGGFMGRVHEVRGIRAP